MNKKTLEKIKQGEGDTPLIRLINTEEYLNWSGEIWGKAEYLNPTGSFKDRGSLLEIAEAVDKKKKGVVCASTGNMAASLASYSTRAGICCTTIVPKITPQSKLKQAEFYSAKVIRVDGNYDSCVKEAVEISKKENLLLCGDYKTRRIGQRSIGLEISKKSTKFDAFIVPVGNGTLGCAISEGFAQKKQYPKFIGIQAKRCNPIVEAWQKNENISKLKNPSTIASAMKVGNPLDGKITLEWVEKTKGSLLTVSDNEIVKAQKDLARLEGIYVEKSAAATLAGLKKLKKNSCKKGKIILILTGNGLKEIT